MTDPSRETDRGVAFYHLGTGGAALHVCLSGRARLPAGDASASATATGAVPTEALRRTALGCTPLDLAVRGALRLVAALRQRLGAWGRLATPFGSPPQTRAARARPTPRSRASGEASPSDASRAPADLASGRRAGPGAGSAAGAAVGAPTPTTPRPPARGGGGRGAFRGPSSEAGSHRERPVDPEADPGIP